jgi:hypothetical protein
MVVLAGCSLDGNGLRFDSPADKSRSVESAAVDKALHNRAYQFDTKVTIQKIEYAGEFSEVRDGKQRVIHLWHVNLTQEGQEPVSALVAVVIENGKVVRMLILSGDEL